MPGYYQKGKQIHSFFTFCAIPYSLSTLYFASYKLCFEGDSKETIDLLTRMSLQGSMPLVSFLVK